MTEIISGRETKKATAFAVRAALAICTLAATSSAQAQYGPYTCVNGLVWREAVASDYVCVNPPSRKQTQDENALGPSRIQPGGGPYGPDTCKQGYVWRETRPTDHVCVPPGSRAKNRLGNQNAYSGYAHPEQLPANATQSGWHEPGSQLIVKPPHLTFYSWEPAKGNYRQLGNYGTYFGERAVTPTNCRKSNDRRMYILAVDEVTGVVSNAGQVAVALCIDN